MYIFFPITNEKILPFTTSRSNFFFFTSSRQYLNENRLLLPYTVKYYCCVSDIKMYIFFLIINEEISLM